MNWRRIPKEKSNQPATGTYRDWKPLLAEEGFHQCVYCSISESSFGGIRNFHVEHYKPKGDSRFTHLENIFSNLFYACPICNGFKSDDWPCEPNNDLNIICYPDPSVIDYSHIFTLDYLTGLIDGINIAAKYILNKLHLNRPQLIINRREQILEKRYEEVKTRTSTQFAKLISIEINDEEKILLIELFNAIKNVEAIFHSREQTTPYTNEQIRRS
jgi:hypothetical protein